MCSQQTFVNRTPLRSEVDGVTRCVEHRFRLVFTGTLQRVVSRFSTDTGGDS